jgi:hypothetical protein
MEKNEKITVLYERCSASLTRFFAIIDQFNDYDAKKLSPIYKYKTRIMVEFLKLLELLLMPDELIGNKKMDYSEFLDKTIKHLDLTEKMVVLCEKCSGSVMRSFMIISRWGGDIEASYIDKYKSKVMDEYLNLLKLVLETIETNNMELGLSVPKERPLYIYGINARKELLSFLKDDTQLRYKNVFCTEKMSNYDKSSFSSKGVDSINYNSNPLNIETSHNIPLKLDINFLPHELDVSAKVAIMQYVELMKPYISSNASGRGNYKITDDSEIVISRKEIKGILKFWTKFKENLDSHTMTIKEHEISIIDWVCSSLKISNSKLVMNDNLKTVMTLHIINEMFIMFLESCKKKTVSTDYIDLLIVLIKPIKLSMQNYFVDY